MKRWIVLITFRPGAAPEAIQSWLAAANQVPDASISENLPGSVGASDAVWDLRTDEAALERIEPIAELLRAGCVQSAEVLAVDPIASGHRPLDGPRVKRTLALTVRSGTPASEVHRFERSLSAMPEHIPEIRSWSLSRVGLSSSTQRWTHVWEQEYAEIAGLRVAYMRNPYHWTGVDRWFDPEMPCCIVDPHLEHVFRWADQPVLLA